MIPWCWICNTRWSLWWKLGPTEIFQWGILVNDLSFDFTEHASHVISGLAPTTSNRESLIIFGSNRQAFTHQTDVNTLERQTWGERRAIISWPKHLLRPCPLASLIGQSLEPEFTREYIPVVASHLPKAIHVITPRWMAKSCCCTCCVTHQFPEFANPLVSPWASKTSIDSRSTYYSVPFLNARPHGSRLARKDSAWGRWELNWREFDLFVVMWTYTYIYHVGIRSCLRN